MIFTMYILEFMPCPSAVTKLVLSILKSFKHTQFLKYTQVFLGLLKSEILLHQLALSIIKNWIML